MVLTFRIWLELRWHFAVCSYVYSDRGPGKGAGKGEKKSKDDPLSQPHEASIFAGGHKEYGDVMVAPALLEYVAKD